jgi:hypothetical protein
VQKHAEKCEITLDLLTEMTLGAYRAAMTDGSAKGADAAVKAVAQLSRMHGFEVGKRPNERSPIEALTVDERDAVRRMVEEALERARADNRLRKASQAPELEPRPRLKSADWSAPLTYRTPKP